MSLSTTVNKVVHSGNASAPSFSFTFPIPDADFLEVIYTDVSGVETTLSPTLYSVTGIGSTTGGSVTYPLSGSPIAWGTYLTIVRVLPYTQEVTLSNQGGYYPDVIEAAFDRVVMMMQQLAEIVSRYTVSSISNPATEQTNYTLIQALQAKAIIINVQSFTNSGTYTPTSGMMYCVVEMWAGGGGGGGTASASANVGCGGGGGGAGGFSRGVFSAATIGASKAVTIGAAGTAGTAGNNAGGNGGQSTFGGGTLAGCVGGVGGGGSNGSTTAAAAGGLGGSGAVDGRTTSGANGGTPLPVGGGNAGGLSGRGGDSYLGGGGSPALAATAATGNAGTGYASGGSGGASFNAGGTAAGGAGTQGLVIIHEYRWA